MDIGKGHWVFALIFCIVFIGVLVWAYARDRHISKAHYRGSYKIILYFTAVLLVLYLFVKYYKR